MFVSIGVPLDELESKLEKYPWAYLATVSKDGRAHVVAVPTLFRDGVFEASVGRSTLVNAADHPDVTMVFPPDRGTDYSLIVDGRIELHDDQVRIIPARAVLHRPALSDHCS